MTVTQVSFSAFAASVCTPSIDPAMGLTLADGAVVRSVVDGGECIRALQTSWLVSVEFLTGARAGEVCQFRWYKRSDALRCKRDFVYPGSDKFSRVTLRECAGRNTFEGWVDA